NSCPCKRESSKSGSASGRTECEGKSRAARLVPGLSPAQAAPLDRHPPSSRRKKADNLPRSSCQSATVPRQPAGRSRSYGSIQRCAPWIECAFGVSYKNLYRVGRGRARGFRRPLLPSPRRQKIHHVLACESLCLCGEIFWLRLCCALQFVAGQTATNSTISRKTTSRRDECSLPEFLQRLPDLLLCVHYERAITGNGLVQRFPGNQQKAD